MDRTGTLYISCDCGMLSHLLSISKCGKDDNADLQMILNNINSFWKRVNISSEYLFTKRNSAILYDDILINYDKKYHEFLGDILNNDQNPTDSTPFVTATNEDGYLLTIEEDPDEDERIPPMINITISFKYEEKWTKRFKNALKYIFNKNEDIAYFELSEDRIRDFKNLFLSIKEEN